MKSDPGSIATTLMSRGALLLPLALGIFTCAPESYWLDSPEFSAAAQMMGIPHPPGHPLWVMLAKPFTLLPFGTIAFRVSVASAVFGAVAAWLLFRLIFEILRAVSDQVPTGAIAALSFAAAMFAATTHAWWFQSVRQEVYSLQILLILGVLLPLVRHCLNPVRTDLRLLHASAFTAGLAMCNHHFIMLAAAPAVIPPLVDLARGKTGWHALRQTVALAGTAAAGLLPYLFLPLRTAAGAHVSLGGVHSLQDFFWVVSAKVYQKSMAREHIAGLDSRTIDTLYSIMSELGPVIVVVAGAGLYLLLRRRTTRMAGVVLLICGTVTLLLRALMGLDAFNPDYYGYLLPLIAVLAIGASVFATVVLHVLQRTSRLSAVLSTVLLIGLVAFVFTRAKDNQSRCDLSQFRSTRHFADAALAPAPPGTLLIAGYFKLFFSLWAPRYVDGYRPDIQVINPHLFGYPGYLYEVTTERPALARLARSMFIADTITETAVADLSVEFPLRIDSSPWIEESAFRHMIPDGPMYRGFPEPLSLTDVQESSARHFTIWQQLYEKLGDGWKEPETFRMLAFSHYMDAIFFARRGDRDSARIAIENARTIGAATGAIMALEDAVNKEEKGPVDVTPLLVEAKLIDAPIAAAPQ